MTVAEFLSRYSISRTEFYRQVNAGHIRLTKLGKASRVARADAEAWVQSLPVRCRAAM
jgi:excisionase family DNA binding protein